MARLNLSVVGDIVWRCSKVEGCFAVCICPVHTGISANTEHIVNTPVHRAPKPSSGQLQASSGQLHTVFSSWAAVVATTAAAGKQTRATNFLFFSRTPAHGHSQNQMKIKSENNKYKHSYRYLSAASARLVHPWHFRGFYFDTASVHYLRTVQLFFDFLLRLIIFVSARFASCFLTFQLLPANLVFLLTRV